MTMSASLPLPSASQALSRHARAVAAAAQAGDTQGFLASTLTQASSHTYAGASTLAAGLAAAAAPGLTGARDPERLGKDRAAERRSAWAGGGRTRGGSGSGGPK